MDDLRELLELTAAIAADFYETLPEPPVYPRATVAELHAALSAPLPEEGGEAWMSGTVWGERPAIRISVSNWQTSDDDVERTVVAFRELAPA